MRKVIIILLLAMVLLAGCESGQSEVNDEKLKIVATIFPPYDFARQITKDAAELTILLPPAAESHSYEPTPQDLIKIRDCDVFIYVGGKSDNWVQRILESTDTSEMRIVTLMDCVEVVQEEIVDGMTVGHEEGNEPDYDEHVWTSPKNAKLIVEKISEAICSADAANADVYKQNTDEYINKLDILDSSFKEVVDGAKCKVMVFGDRFPFRYFADAYGLEYYAAYPGCSDEIGASIATVKFLIDKINAEKIPAVFHVELSSEKMAETIREATGAKVMLLHSCHNISREDFDAGKDYLDLMEGNLEALKEALY